ncbi:REST corepressor 3, partial [Trichonephila inaurata madagascariensis]
VKVGSKYQTVIPNLIPEGLRQKTRMKMKELSGHLDLQSMMKYVMVKYMNEAREKFEYSQEQSLGILFVNGYDVEQAREDVLKYEPRSVKWNREDKALFEEGFNLHGKDFDMICKMIYEGYIGICVNGIQKNVGALMIIMNVDEDIFEPALQLVFCGKIEVCTNTEDENILYEAIFGFENPSTLQQRMNLE